MDDVYTLDDEDSFHDGEAQFSAASSPASHEGEAVNEEVQVGEDVRDTSLDIPLEEPRVSIQVKYSKWWSVKLYFT